MSALEVKAVSTHDPILIDGDEVSMIETRRYARRDARQGQTCLLQARIHRKGVETAITACISSVDEVRALWGGEIFEINPCKEVEAPRG